VQFEITILGCGAATPTLRHAPTAQAVNWQGKWILLDCGEGLQTNLRQYKIPLQKIDLICISHMHGDHVLGLPGLLGSMNLFGRERPLRIAGPSAIESFVRQTLEHTETYVRFPLEFIDCVGLDGDSVIEWGDNVIRSFAVKHRIEAYGFTFVHSPSSRKIHKDSIDQHGLTRSEILSLKAGDDITRADGYILRVEEHCEPLKPMINFTYSGDTRPTETVADAARNADVLYHEATFLQELAATAKSTGHSTAQQAAKLGNEAGVRLLILGHLSSRYRDESKVLNEAKAFHPNVHLADEGMRIRLAPGESPSINYLE
jgi:ribonuclease Z